MKVCKRCYLEKENKDFYLSKASKYGLNSWCKDCKKVYNKESGGKRGSST